MISEEMSCNSRVNTRSKRSVIVERASMVSRLASLDNADAWYVLFANASKNPCLSRTAATLAAPAARSVAWPASDISAHAFSEGSLSDTMVSMMSCPSLRAMERAFDRACVPTEESSFALGSGCCGLRSACSVGIGAGCASGGQGESAPTTWR